MCAFTPLIPKLDVPASDSTGVAILSRLAPGAVKLAPSSADATKGFTNRRCLIGADSRRARCPIEASIPATPAAPSE